MAAMAVLAMHIPLAARQLPTQEAVVVERQVVALPQFLRVLLAQVELEVEVTEVLLLMALMGLQTLVAVEEVLVSLHHQQQQAALAALALSS